MKNLKISIIAAATACALPLAAQNSYSGYFLDNFDYRYQMNPAAGNDNNFVSMPAIGNLNVGLHGNLHLNSVLYTIDGRTVLFSNPNISTQEVMSNISNVNKLQTNIKVPVMSAGFKSWGGYNTVSINAVADVGVGVPRSLFSLVKEGVTNKTYDIKDIRAKAMGYGEIAFGHSRDIKQVPGLRVGAAVKVLIGVANVDAFFNKADLTLGEDKWTAITNADVYANIGGLQYEQKYDEDSHRDYVSGVNLDADDSSIGPNGFGLGFDLGAEYKLNDDWKFSFAALDLGFISFSRTMKASTNGDRTFDTDAYIFNADSDAENSFKNEWKNFRTGLSDLYQLSDEGNVGSRTQGLAATINIGAQYTFHLYRNLTFGLLNSTRINGPFTWTQFRLSANVMPVKVFSADVNVACGTYGWSFGWMFNVHTTGFNLFASMDHTPGKLCKQGVPLNSNAQFALGINFPF